VVKKLKLKISGKDGSEIAKDISRPFWIKEDKTFLVDEDKIWEGFGLALSDSKPGISSLFENILREEKWAGVLGRLREAGVPENTVLELEQDILIQVAEPKIDTPEQILRELATKLPPSTNPREDGNSERSVGTKGTENSYSERINHSTESAETGRQHGNTQARQKKGKEAEDWFRKELIIKLEPHGWQVSNSPRRDEENLESDILLRHKQRGTFHIEVKHAEAGELYWSIGEVRKASKNIGCYWMVIMNPSDAQAEYRSIIIEDPLETLKNYERRGKWIWNEESGNVNEGWNQPEPKPMKEANNFSFRININNLDWNKFPEAIDFLSRKLL
jgi:hypothetical protein